MTEQIPEDSTEHDCLAVLSALPEFLGAVGSVLSGFSPSSPEQMAALLRAVHIKTEEDRVMFRGHPPLTERQTQLFQEICEQAAMVYYKTYPISVKDLDPWFVPGENT